MGINYFRYAGKNSTDFGVWISGESTFASPEKDIEAVVIPGKNGTLTIDNGRFHNIAVPYPAFIIDNFEENFDAFKAFLTSVKGYARLSDTYHPDYFRLARFNSSIDPQMTQDNRHGQFTVTFDCDPRRFLVSGDRALTFTAGSSIRNQTMYDAKPLIRAYGTGYFSISGIRVNINSANVYTDIDCELQEAYKGTINCNGNITLVNGEFPILKSGENTIVISGLSKIEVTPHWWTI